MYLFPVVESEIKEIIDQVTGSKSVGPFSIPTELLNSFSTGKVPHKFKIAKVIPGYKKGNNNAMI